MENECRHVDLIVLTTLMLKLYIMSDSSEQIGYLFFIPPTGGSQSQSHSTCIHA